MWSEEHNARVQSDQLTVFSHNWNKLPVHISKAWEYSTKGAGRLYNSTLQNDGKEQSYPAFAHVIYMSAN